MIAKILLVASCLALCLEASNLLFEGSRRSPVIFIPGNGGNQLDAKVDKPADPSDPCPTKLDWHRLWLDIWSLRSSKLPCWTKIIEMQYDPATGKSHNLDGVSTRVRGWGTLDTVDYIDPSWSAYLLANVGAYFSHLSKVMKGWGYRDGVDLRAAPYDFRHLPDFDNFMPRLKALVEDTYKKNGNTKVSLLAHSLGCRFALLFLQQQPQQWKDRYIHAFISMGGPWAGAMLEHILYASGYNMGISIVDPAVIRREQRTSETNMFLLATEAGFRNTPLVQTPTRTYTVADYSAFFRDIQYPVGIQRISAMERDRNNLTAPGVPVHCLYGTGVPTPKTAIYKQQNFPGGQPTIVNGDGDGTVNTESLKLCSLWGSTSSIKTFPGLHHEKMFSNSDLQNYIKTVVLLNQGQSYQ